MAGRGRLGPLPGAAAPAPALQRSVGLDLLRAIAVSLVLLCHLHLTEVALSGGPIIWRLAACGLVGVQLFFVLSGFLIGRILIGLAAPPQRDAGHVCSRRIFMMVRSWRIFMMRRWLRTLPLYWLVLLLLALLWPPAAGQGGVPAHLLRWGTLSQNLFRPAPDGWLSVSWSLTVEEWFYLLFSALLLGLSPVLRRGGALALCLALFLLAPPLLRCLLGGGAWSASQDHVVPLWFDGIAIGVVAAWALPRLALDAASSLTLLPVGLLLVWFVLNGGLSLLPGVGPALRRSFDNDILSLGFALCLPASLALQRLPAPLLLVVRRLAGWSYCLYLVHLPLLEAGARYGPRWGLSPPAIGALCLAAAFALSWLSWRFFEAPLLALRPRQAHRPLAAPA